MVHRAKHPPSMIVYPKNQPPRVDKKALSKWIADCGQMLGGYRDGSEGKQKPFKPKHYPGYIQFHGTVRRHKKIRRTVRRKNEPA